jgi:hypothetical protein
MAAKFRNTGHESRPLLDRKAPDVAKKLKIEPLRATFGHIRPSPTISHYRARQHATHADAARVIEPHQTVGARHANIEGVEVVAVHHPDGRRRQHRDLLPPSHRVGNLPAGAPIMGIEMNYRQPELRAEPARERRFACARTADHHDAIHRSLMGPTTPRRARSLHDPHASHDRIERCVKAASARRP